MVYFPLTLSLSFSLPPSPFSPLSLPSPSSHASPTVTFSWHQTVSLSCVNYQTELAGRGWNIVTSWKQCSKSQPRRRIQTSSHSSLEREPGRRQWSQNSLGFEFPTHTRPQRLLRTKYWNIRASCSRGEGSYSCVDFTSQLGITHGSLLG